MTLNESTQRLCPKCNKSMVYRMWEDIKANTTYLKLSCPNGCDYKQEQDNDLFDS